MFVDGVFCWAFCLVIFLPQTHQTQRRPGHPAIRSQVGAWLFPRRSSSWELLRYRQGVRWIDGWIVVDELVDVSGNGIAYGFMQFI